GMALAPLRHQAHRYACARCATSKSAQKGAWFPLRLLRPDTSDQVRIGHELLIGGVESCGLDDRLRDENAIEGIAVQQRQPTDESRRVRANRQFGEPGIEGGSGDLGRIEDKIVAAQSSLDGDLPDAGGAEQHLGVAPFDCGAGLSIEPVRLGERPQQDKGIEQHTHQRPSKASMTSSGNGASKSSGTRSFPAKTPRRRCRCEPMSGPKRATGLPDLAIMISSPAAAASTKRDNWVLAA